MSKHKQHTLEPWYYIGDGVVMADPDNDGEGFIIAEVHSPLPCDADGYLIAAAPKLLGACRPVLAEAKERADYMHQSWNPDAHVELTLTIAELRTIHAAVAKASGVAS